jgi:hypothetical protein
MTHNADPLPMSAVYADLVQRLRNLSPDSLSFVASQHSLIAEGYGPHTDDLVFDIADAVTYAREG